MDKLPHCYRCRSPLTPQGTCECSDGACVICGDALPIMQAMPEKAVDLVFGSPPYEDCRTYGIDFALQGQEWVDWMVQVVEASLHVCRGLVAFVVEGKTRKFRWSATPALLMADLHRKGVHLRKPPVFHRAGIPGSGGPDWLRNDYEFIVCCTNGGKLPWSENKAMGRECKYKTGGAMSYRTQDGKRINERKHNRGSAALSKQKAVNRNGRPAIANPGNVIHCTVGGGLMGHPLAHHNEAPFPESLVEWFVRSFCPEGGVVLDPFSGSGTTMAVAKKWNRRGIGIDLRDSQCDIACERLRQGVLL